MRHDLPSGAWVELRDPMQVTHGQWTEAVAALAEVSTNLDLAAAVSIEAWSYPAPPPSPADASSLAEVPQVDFKAIGQLMMPVLRMLHPMFGPENGAAADPDSPTGPSSG